jgi:hypothetical protein
MLRRVNKPQHIRNNAKAAFNQGLMRLLLVFVQNVSVREAFMFARVKGAGSFFLDSVFSMCLMMQMTNFAV